MILGTKRRVFQVAREFNISNDALKIFLKKLDFDVPSHMSPITDEMYEEICKKFSQDIKVSDNDFDFKRKLKEKKAIEKERKEKELH